ncbi:hypothetical protein LTR84_005673 [Exophiala bonariae]|uniref:Fungal STAND N-terminal Goodbye domain-containing protein n=1 Tax=Exophiala bonariae TaxID=1690606 RepID=A0AAV9N6H4_9EURO|nr:hypothetical protein LTR84_005673 [Exophiala bonariae]
MGSVASPILDRDDYSFKAMWEQAQLRFQERTSKSLKSATGHSLEDVLSELEKKYPEDNIFQSLNDSQSNVKDVVRNVLNCISILGGIVAQGASMAFGGAADICYSAISFLIEMHARIDRLYEGLAQLFEEISTFLKTFKIYKRIEKFAEVDPELKATTGRLMISFVDICALSIKLLNGSKWKKFKTVLKVALMDDDSGIRAELEKFKGLIDQSSRISDAVTLEKVMISHHEVVELLEDASRRSGQQLLYLEDISTGVNVLKADMVEHKTQQIHLTQVQEIMKKLSINQETAKLSAKYLEDLRTSPIPNTGIWLKEMAEYQSWSDGIAVDTKSLLILEGGEKSGKSFLIGSIMDELDFQFREGRKSENRVSVAYYCFSRVDKKLETSKFIQHPHLPSTALKSIAVRIAEQNISYAKEMATFWATRKATDHRNMSCRELWDALQLSSPKGDGMYYLIFDGLEVLAEGDACELFEVLLNIQSSKVRLLAASNKAVIDSSLESFQDRLTRTAIPRIDVEISNGPDIRTFVDHYLSQNGELFGRDVETSKLKAWLRDELPEIVKGNFFLLQTALDRCAEDYKRSQSVSDIIQNLKSVDLSQDSSIAARQVIARLNKSLSNQEIDQLNEMITWVVYGKKWLTLDELRAALFLRFKAQPAQPLAAQLGSKGKYVTLFNVDEFVYTRDNIDPVLVVDSRKKRIEGNAGKGDNPRISMTLKITNADFETVQRFLWDLGERAVFEKFAFENIQTSLEVQKRIYVHEVEACIAIISRCIDLLLAEPDEYSIAMVDYALWYLPEHLENLKTYVDAREVKDSEMQSVVDKLVNLLSDTECIEKHWTRGPNTFHYGLPIFTWCLYKTNVVESLRPRDRRWLEKRDITKDPKISCLHDIALMVAEQWLRRRVCDYPEAFAKWIFHYVKNLKMASSTAVADNEKDKSASLVDTINTSVMDTVVSADLDLDSESISRAAAWVEQELRFKNLDSLWFERLGQTFLETDLLDDAAAAFLRAKSLPGAHRMVSRGLAEVYNAKGEFEMAIKELDPVIDDIRARSGNKIEVHDDDRTFLLDALRLQAEWHTHCEPPNTERAVALYREILELEPGKHFIQWQLIKVLAEANWLSDALEFLRSLRGQPAEDFGNLDQLAKMLFYSWSDSEKSVSLDTIYLFVSVTANDPLTTSILNNLTLCIDRASKLNDTAAVVALLLFEGIAVFQYNLGSSDQKEAILSWKRCYSLGSGMRKGSEQDEVRFAVGHATKRISYYYHELFKKGGADAQRNIAELQGFYLEAQQTRWVAQTVGFTLAACHASSSSPDKARDLLFDDMKTALDLLSDDDPDNDYIGYLWMAELLLHAGDELNSLSAFSLHVPEDVDRVGMVTSQDDTKPSDDNDKSGDATCNDEDHGEGEVTDNDAPEDGADEEAIDDVSQKSGEPPSTSSSRPNTPAANDAVPRIEIPETTIVAPTPQVRLGKATNNCDGRCGTSWTYADDFYVCKICSDVQFDLGCLNKLRAGKLKAVVCSPNHDWLHIPPFSDEEYHKVGKGNVRMGGTFIDGARQGGEIVPVAVWVDAIRAQWGILKKG